MRLPAIQLTMSAEIRAPINAVWGYLVDWEALYRWMSELSALRITSTRREGIGVEGVASVRIGGITTRDKIRVTDWDPPVRLTIA
ncbi:MAG TPA: SRPBCC family protein, partial [Candidatus Dormibacteraeota bacterium]|nr:SRPBCC family protein [Candidatus Dormibacteraeota bacterium]